MSKWGALRSRDFRYYWSGFIISVTGIQMMFMVQGWLVYELTGSKLLLGVVGLVQAVPATLLTLLGGVVADKVDQRRLLINLQFVHILSLGSLAALCFTDVIQVWHILVFVSVRAAAIAFDHPAQQAMFPHLVERRSLTSAVALNATVHPGTRIFGPAVAGIVLAQMVDHSSATMAAGTVFAITAGGHAINALLLQRVHLPPVRRSRGVSVLQDTLAGVQFVWANRVFAFLIGMAYFCMFFALSVTALFPVFAKDILHTGPSGLGFLYTALGAGSLMGALLGAGLGSPQRWRRMIIGGTLLQGAFLVIFALSSWYAVSLLALVIMGIGASLFSVATQSTLQTLLANEFRGRVMALWSLTHIGLRPAGEMQFGAMAALLSAPIAVVIGGGLVMGFALLVAGPNRRVKEISATPVEV